MNRVGLLKRLQFILGLSVPRPPAKTSATLPCTPDFDRLTGSRTRRSLSRRMCAEDFSEAAKVSLLRRGPCNQLLDLLSRHERKALAFPSSS